jgi:hypothetical protein
MSKHPSGRRNTSVLPALTPALDRSLPPATTVVSDLRTEEILFNLYRSMKAQRDSWKAQAQHYRRMLQEWKAKGFAKKLSYKLKPSHKGDE